MKKNKTLQRFPLHADYTQSYAIQHHGDNHLNFHRHEILWLGKCLGRSMWWLAQGLVSQADLNFLANRKGSWW